MAEKLAANDQEQQLELLAAAHKSRRLAQVAAKERERYLALEVRASKDCEEADRLKPRTAPGAARDRWRTAQRVGTADGASMEEQALARLAELAMHRFNNPRAGFP